MTGAARGIEVRGTEREIEAELGRRWPEAPAAVARAKAAIEKRQLLDWQALLLFGLTRDLKPSRILEIGTLHGFSALLMALAAPRALLTTLNPVGAEVARARGYLRGCANVTVVARASWDYLRTDRESYDLVFVDGDHRRVALDLPWFQRLRLGGLMLFHDYSPIACPPVFEAVRTLSHRGTENTERNMDRREGEGNGLDVVAMDDAGIGMAGLFRAADRPR